MHMETPACLSARRILTLCLIVTLAACGRVVPPSAPPPVSTPSPRPNPAPVPPAPPPVAWDQEPATPGTWRHRLAGEDSIADFFGPDGRHVAQLICTGDKSVEVAVLGRAMSAQTMTIRTRTVERAVTAAAMEGSVYTRLDPRDPLLAAMAYSRGRFALEVPGLPALYLPAWPEVTRVVDDCQ